MKIHISHRADGSVIMMVTFRPGWLDVKELEKAEHYYKSRLRPSDCVIVGILGDCEVTSGPERQPSRLWAWLKRKARLCL